MSGTASNKDQGQGSQQPAENYWLQYIRAWYPELHKDTYFLPPIPFNRVPYSMENIGPSHTPTTAKTRSHKQKRQNTSSSAQNLSGPVEKRSQDNLHLQPVCDKDVRGDKALERVLYCLRALADNSQEVMMVISQLQFGNYLGEPSYAATAALLPRPCTLSKHLLQQHYHEGDIDVLIIHRQHGLFSEIKSVGANFSQLKMTEQQEDDVVMKKVKEAEWDIGESNFSAQQDSFPSCLHLLGKTGCCKSGTGISKLGTDDLMEVDRRNAKTTDRQIPSNKDMDTPGIFDTHLTKKDVYSKIPQNDWREGIFNLRRKHLPVFQVIFLFLLLISFAEGVSSHCEINHTMNCTDLFLICSFDTDIIQLAKSLFMNHEQNNSMDLEIILVCQTSSKGFLCETSPTYEFVSVESNRLTVKIPEVNLKHVGKYWCDVQGFVDNDRKVCELSLPDNFEQENGPHCKEYWSSPATIAIILLSSSLGFAGTSLILFLLYIFSKHQIHYATRFNLKNCKSEIRTNNKHEEACELL